MENNTKDLVHFEKIAIFGVGLLGGAIGMATRRLKLADKVTGIGRSEERLRRAVELGAIDNFTTDIGQGARDCDFLILALPVKKIIESLPRIAAAVKPGCIVTDVGSTKKSIVEAARDIFTDDRFFVGSHPMTGSDKSGVENAHLVKFKGVTGYVTLAPETNRQAAAKVALFWKSLGMIPVLIDPGRHDAYAGLLSHLPHIAAVGLVNVVLHSPDDLNFLKQLTGAGFRHTTRIAKGDVTMWLDICLDNVENIVNYINQFTKELEKVKSAIEKKDASELQTLLENAKDFRQKFD